MTQKPVYIALTLLALTMHLMAQLTPLWLTQSNGFTIQICSGQDVRTISIDENGNEIPNTPKVSKKHCAFCLASGDNNNALKTEAPTSLQTTHTKNSLSAKKTLFPVEKNRRKAYPARAPPQIS